MIKINVDVHSYYLLWYVKSEHTVNILWLLCVDTEFNNQTEIKTSMMHTN